MIRGGFRCVSGTAQGTHGQEPGREQRGGCPEGVFFLHLVPLYFIHEEDGLLLPGP